MSCSACAAEGRTSVVASDGPRSSRAASYSVYFDDRGRMHTHDRNARTTSYSCSNGHRWEMTEIGSCWCGWRDTGGGYDL